MCAAAMCLLSHQLASRKKKYKDDAAESAVKEATDGLRQLVGGVAKQLRESLDNAAAALDAQATVVDLRARTATAWASALAEMTRLEAHLAQEKTSEDSVGRNLKPLERAVDDLAKLKQTHGERLAASLADALGQRGDVMRQAVRVLADRPAISNVARYVGIIEQDTVRVLESTEKIRMVRKLADARTILHTNLQMLRVAPQQLHPTVLQKTRQLDESVRNLQQLPELTVLSNVAAARARMQAAGALVDKKHKQAEGIAEVKKRYTDLRAELAANYDLQTWDSCGREWRQDASGLLRTCDKDGVCERCKNGGNLQQTIAACRYFKEANGLECKLLGDDDLVAARVYTRPLPHISHRLNDALRNHMNEPDVPPDEHLSMYVHLQNAIKHLKGAGQDDRLYRGQKYLYGHDKSLDPEDPKQYAPAS